MTLVVFSESGYCFSLVAWLNSVVRMGARKGVRSLIIAGLIL